MDIPSVLMTFCPQNLENGLESQAAEPAAVRGSDPGTSQRFPAGAVSGDSGDAWFSDAFLWIFELGTVVSQGDLGMGQNPIPLVN